MNEKSKSENISSNSRSNGRSFRSASTYNPTREKKGDGFVSNEKMESTNIRRVFRARSTYIPKQNASIPIMLTDKCVGSIVFGKTYGFPPWPGKIVECRKYSCKVEFFGSYDSRIVLYSDIYPFLEFRDQFGGSSHKKCRNLFEKAMTEATKALRC